MNKKETNEFVLKHGVKLPNGQVFITKVMTVFKKVYVGGRYNRQHCIATLLIPVGAIVNLSQTKECKLRTNEAICWNIVKREKGTKVRSAYSGYNDSYKYVPIEGKTRISLSNYKKQYMTFKYRSWANDIIRPLENFNMSRDECSAGIHFFIERSRAEGWG